MATNLSAPMLSGETQAQADARYAAMRAEQAQRQVDRQNIRAGTALQGTYVAPQSSVDYVAALNAGQSPVAPGYATGQINQPLINAISDGGQYASTVRPVDQFFPMGGAQRPPQQSYSPPTSFNPAPASLAPAPASTPSNPNTAIVDALRQKPARFEGFGMGLGTNATTPQVNALMPVNKLGTKNPGGLFSMR